MRVFQGNKASWIFDFLCSDKIKRYLRLVEDMLGSIQEKFQTASKIDAVQNEVRAMEKK